MHGICNFLKLYCFRLLLTYNTDQRTGIQNSVSNLCFDCAPSGYQQTRTVELQQRSSSVATQQTTVSSIPSHPSTTGVSTSKKTQHQSLILFMFYLLLPVVIGPPREQVCGISLV